MALVNPPRRHQLLVALRDDEWEEISKLAERLGRSRSNLVRRACRLAEEQADRLLLEEVPTQERWRG